MSRLELATIRFAILDDANRAIAFHRGQIARVHNRPNTGALVPKLESETEHEAWQNGWNDTDKVLALNSKPE